MRKKKTAIFASGSGTNAENIIRYFKGHKAAEVSLVLCNNPAAGVLERAARLETRSYTFNRKDLYQSAQVSGILKQNEIDFIVLAGFLWLIPVALVTEYPARIVNIHPALLPDYGGKGMYGDKVHQAVIQNGEKQSGITVHTIDEVYDRGKILFQATCPVHAEDTPAKLAKRIHDLEYRHFPKVIESWVNR